MILLAKRQQPTNRWAITSTPHENHGMDGDSTKRWNRCPWLRSSPLPIRSHKDSIQRAVLKLTSIEAFVFSFDGFYFVPLPLAIFVLVGAFFSPCLERFSSSTFFVCREQILFFYTKTLFWNILSLFPIMFLCLTRSFFPSLITFFLITLFIFETTVSIIIIRTSLFTKTYVFFYLPSWA